MEDGINRRTCENPLKLDALFYHRGADWAVRSTLAYVATVAMRGYAARRRGGGRRFEIGQMLKSGERRAECRDQRLGTF